MRLAAVYIVGLVGLVGLVAAGCSVNHRSGDFACERQSDCSSGRTCIDGFCVASQVDSGVKQDAPPAIDANVCPSQCTSCNNNSRTCTIDCMLNGGACGLQVKCPEGWNCNLVCSTFNSCTNGVVCPDNRTCNITCSGIGSCSNFQCATGACTVACTGRDSCSDISCGNACACDISCVSLLSCEGLKCRDRCTASTGCSSEPQGCNTCVMR